jgi:hypothetical protein
VISAEFGKSKDKKYNVMNSLMRHRDEWMTPMWASKFMEVLASVIYEDEEASMYEAVAELVGNAALGTFFECIAHRKLTSDRSFELQPLYKKGTRGVSRTPIVLDLSDKHVVALHSIDDIRELPADSYGLPAAPNFPLVDAIVQPNLLLQMTVSAGQHRGATEHLPLIRAQLQERDASKHKMVFVLPQKNMKTFLFQEDLRDIKQFILCPDATKKRKLSL